MLEHSRHREMRKQKERRDTLHSGASAIVGLIVMGPSRYSGIPRALTMSVRIRPGTKGLQIDHGVTLKRRRKGTLACSPANGSASAHFVGRGIEPLIIISTCR